MKDAILRRTIAPLLVGACGLTLNGGAVAEMPADYGGDNKAVIRIFSPDMVFDFAVSTNNEVRLIQEYSRNREASDEPSLANAYVRNGRYWDEWKQQNEEAARKLRGLLKRWESFTRVAFNKEETLVALTRATNFGMTGSELVLLAWPSQKPILEKRCLIRDS